MANQEQARDRKPRKDGHSDPGDGRGKAGLMSGRRPELMTPGDSDPGRQ